MRFEISQGHRYQADSISRGKKKLKKRSSQNEGKYKADFIMLWHSTRRPS